MCTQYQKNLSVILLTSLLLQSCGADLTLDSYSHRMKGGPDERRNGHSSIFDQPCADSLVNAVESAESPEPDQSTPATAFRKPCVSYSTRKPSSLPLRQLQLDTDIPPLSAEHSQRNVSFKTTSEFSHLQEPGKPGLIPPTESSVVTAQSAFTTSDGQTAQFQQVNGKWKVHVSDQRFPGCSSKVTYPVVCERGENMASLLERIVNQPALQPLRIHLVPPRGALLVPVCVVYGHGLRGGMHNGDGYQSDGSSSADEDDRGEFVGRFKHNFSDVRQQQQVMLAESKGNGADGDRQGEALLAALSPAQPPQTTTPVAASAPAASDDEDAANNGGDRGADTPQTTTPVAAPAPAASDNEDTANNGGDRGADTPQTTTPAAALVSALVENINEDAANNGGDRRADTPQTTTPVAAPAPEASNSEDAANNGRDGVVAPVQPPQPITPAAAPAPEANDDEDAANNRRYRGASPVQQPQPIASVAAPAQQQPRDSDRLLTAALFGGISSGLVVVVGAAAIVGGIMFARRPG